MTPGEAVRDAALRLLSFRSRSVQELRDRLIRKGFSRTHVSECLEWLQTRKYLDDGAFSRSMVRHRLRLSPRSPHLLEQELARKGVAETVAREAVRAVLDDEGATEETLAAEAARAWVGKQTAQARDALLGQRYSPDRERQRRRLHGFLSRRGFRGGPLRGAMQAAEEEARDQER